MPYFKPNAIWFFKKFYFIHLKKHSARFVGSKNKKSTVNAKKFSKTIYEKKSFSYNARL